MSIQEKKASSYDSGDIEVLEGLEPVRKRPGMYIGGTDSRAYHHLASEIIDNSMDEAVEGHATTIIVHLTKDNVLSIEDDGRGIPVGNHPKFPKISTLQVIFTTLHAGGKFSGKNYKSAGGLHGVGSSVVNALSDMLCVESFREGFHFSQNFSKGLPLGPLEKLEKSDKTGTRVSFHPDAEIFGTLSFDAKKIYELCKSKAYLRAGVRFIWSCDPEIAKNVPQSHEFCYEKGLQDFLESELEAHDEAPIGRIFSGKQDLSDEHGRVEWSVAWVEDKPDGLGLKTFCNTIPNPLGGTHEAGFRTALYKSFREYGERVGNKEAPSIVGEDVLSSLVGALSLFISDPQFGGQTKEKLTSPDVQKWVEQGLKEACDLWLVENPAMSSEILESILERTRERLNRRKAKEKKSSGGRGVRLPGKLTDCTSKNREDAELFLVEGDSAGGSAKQARFRETQAILPLRGKVLNAISATTDKLSGNKELNDLVVALGCGMGDDYKAEDLRYNKVILMTDADVDGSHIASLLIGFFWRYLPKLILDGHLYLSCPPLYRLRTKTRSVYVMNDQEKEREMKKFSGKEKIEISRFKGLGEMPPADLKETTMSKETRTLLRVEVQKSEESAEDLVGCLLGKKPSARYNFILENSESFNSENLDV